MPLNVTPEGWMQIPTTLCFPLTEPHPSSSSKSKVWTHVAAVLCWWCIGEIFKNERVIDPSRFAVAESDCNLAIALDSNYLKAYARRGAARFELKKYESALEGD